MIGNDYERDERGLFFIMKQGYDWKWAPLTSNGHKVLFFTKEECQRYLDFLKTMGSIERQAYASVIA